MKAPRKLSDIWKAIDDKRLEVKMGKHEWKQSFEGVKAAIEYIGLKMITTKEELDELEVPLDRNGIKKYGYRIIEISKNGIVSKAAIKSILNGFNSLKTDEEMQVLHKKLGIDRSLAQPKGTHISNNAELKSIDDLDELIGIRKYVNRHHLVEFRLYDIAYSLIDDIDDEVFVADQVKSGRVDKDGRVKFCGSKGIINVCEIISILKNGSLTCIGKNKYDKIDVVWFLYGIDAINILSKFELYSDK